MLHSDVDVVDQDQPAVFVMLMRKIEVEALDFDLLLYHVLKVRLVEDYGRTHRD